jgi:serine O-acetyltransferase
MAIVSSFYLERMLGKNSINGRSVNFMNSQMGWDDVRAYLSRDRERLLELLRLQGKSEPSVLWLHPSYQSVFFFRLAAYHFQKGRRMLARMLWHINFYLTGADFGVTTVAGPGLVILHPASTQLFGKVGADCTFFGWGGVGGGRSAKDVGAGPGLPVIGDRVTFRARSLVLGPVQVGDDCEVGPGCFVMRDLVAGSRTETAAPLFVQKI